MSFWDDIADIAGDIYNYVEQGVSKIAETIIDIGNAISNQAEHEWRETSDVANRAADIANELGITISQGFVDAINDALRAKYELLAEKDYGPFPDKSSPDACTRVTGKAIAAVFVKIAVEGEEYDVFGLLSKACEDNNKAMIKAGVSIVVDRIGDQIYNIPRVAEVLKNKTAMKDYLAFVIYKAATQNPKLMAGRAGQAVTGLVMIRMSALLCEGKVDADAPEWPDLTYLKPDRADPDAPTVWPEGSRVFIENGIYLVLDGNVRNIPDPNTYDNLFENRNNIITSAANLQVIGEPLTPGAYLAAGDTRVYLVNDGVKRWIASPQVFQKYHFNAAVVKTINAGELKDIPMGNTIYQYVKRDGAVIKLNDALYLLLDKSAHHIPDPATFDRLFANWSKILEVAVSSVPIGKPITNDAYLATAGDKVYLVNMGEKRWIMSPMTFNSYNFNWGRIKLVPEAELKNIPDGKTIY
jgi:hypothetical protein